MWIDDISSTSEKLWICSVWSFTRLSIYLYRNHHITKDGYLALPKKDVSEGSRDMLKGLHLYRYLVYVIVDFIFLFSFGELNPFITTVNSCVKVSKSEKVYLFVLFNFLLLG